MRASMQARCSSSSRDASALRERLLELGERVAAPERERLAEAPRRQVGVARRMRRLSLTPQLLEPDEIDARGVDLDGVAGRACLEDAVGQHLSQLRDVDLHHLLCGVGDGLAPEVVDEAVGSDGPVGVEQQPREQSPLLAARDRDGRRPIAHLEGPQELELHRSRDVTRELPHR